MEQPKQGNYALIRDPAFARNRIFVGNLPENTTRDEIESIFGRYGTILSILVQKNFGFVQYESEAVANKAASVTSGSLFKGNKITVRNAGVGKPKAKNQAENHNAESHPQVSLQAMLQQYHSSVAADYNDCEIIVVNKANTEYAEYIEQRLKRIGLKVDLLFPNEDVPIGKVLANISGRGCLYAILVTLQNEEHRSITVNILYGEPAEHRNMPVEDAINLIYSNFQEKLNAIHMKRMQESLPISLPSVSNSTSTSAHRHPEAIQALLNLLAENRPITVLQYDRVIKYLMEQRQKQVKAEIGEDVSAPVPPLLNPKPAVVKPDPEIELQKKILNILNKPSITDSKNDLVYPTIHSIQSDPETIELLKDVRVQKALDSLMKISPLVATIEAHYKF
ncbi:unnamed protein product [Hermetia illucens]|uniref:RRM domain-containing protein n=2 Tax=Hermetia illucens TaxID=343691 RepID=A0A7R8YR13_HERIL|nr:unnamed protein product [Hermetia illucens]